jgi:hypothetical protein
VAVADVIDEVPPDDHDDDNVKMEEMLGEAAGEPEVKHEPDEKKGRLEAHIMPS